MLITHKIQTLSWSIRQGSTMSEKEEAHEEIIIVRRGHGDHDDHHGPVSRYEAPLPCLLALSFTALLGLLYLLLWLKTPYALERESLPFSLNKMVSGSHSPATIKSS